jgi:hypothetical protein
MWGEKKDRKMKMCIPWILVVFLLLLIFGLTLQEGEQSKAQMKTQI